MSVDVDVEVEVGVGLLRVKVVIGVLLEVGEAVEELEVEEMVKLRLLEVSPEPGDVPLAVVLVTIVLGTHLPLTATSPFLVQYPLGHD